MYPASPVCRVRFSHLSLPTATIKQTNERMIEQKWHYRWDLRLFARLLRQDEIEAKEKADINLHRDRFSCIIVDRICRWDMVHTERMGCVRNKSRKERRLRVLFLRLACCCYFVAR